jgi:hypothetical protein
MNGHNIHLEGTGDARRWLLETRIAVATGVPIGYHSDGNFKLARLDILRFHYFFLFIFRFFLPAKQLSKVVFSPLNQNGFNLNVNGDLHYGIGVTTTAGETCRFYEASSRPDQGVGSLCSEHRACNTLEFWGDANKKVMTVIHFLIGVGVIFLGVYVCGLQVKNVSKRLPIGGKWMEDKHTFNLHHCDPWESLDLRIEGAVTGSKIKWTNRGNSDQVVINRISFQSGPNGHAIFDVQDGNAITQLEVYAEEGKLAPKITCSGLTLKVIPSLPSVVSSTTTMESKVYPAHVYFPNSHTIIHRLRQSHLHPHNLFLFWLMLLVVISAGFLSSRYSSKRLYCMATSFGETSWYVASLKRRNRSACQ